MRTTHLRGCFAGHSPTQGRLIPSRVTSGNPPKSSESASHARRPQVRVAQNAVVPSSMSTISRGQAAAQPALQGRRSKSGAATPPGVSASRSSASSCDPSAVLTLENQPSAKTSNAGTTVQRQQSGRQCTASSSPAALDSSTSKRSGALQIQALNNSASTASKSWTSTVPHLNSLAQRLEGLQGRH